MAPYLKVINMSIKKAKATVVEEATIEEVMAEETAEETVEETVEETAEEISNDKEIFVKNTMDVTHCGIPAGGIGYVTYGVFRSTIGLIEYDEFATPAEPITEIPEYRDETGRSNSDQILVTNTSNTVNYGIQPGDTGYISYGLFRSSIGFREVENA